MIRSRAVQPLHGLVVIDLTRYLPGPFASRELRRLGARVVRLEPPEGDPLRSLAPTWDRALNAGKESVVCDLKREPELGRALLACADVVLEGFRPGVAARLGVGPADVPETVVYCSLTGFGSEGSRALRAGHDLNYLGAALFEREHTGRGRRIELSLTHNVHRLVAHRVGGDPLPRLLTGGLACYRIYATADGRWLTVGSLEERFFRRLCELVGREDLVERQYDPAAQEELGNALAEIFAAKPLATWLELFDGEDVSVGPVATLEEAAAEFGTADDGEPVALGAHTDAWRRELGFSA